MNTPVSPAPADVVLVTGIAGSGKSVAMHALEDAGFYCVDNLPPELLREFIRLQQARGSRRIAVAVDVRSTGSPSRLVELVASLRQSSIPVQVLFLEAATDVLVRRFSESRRPHPLSDSASPSASGQASEAVPVDRRVLIDAIALERELMAELRDSAAVVDTSQLRPAQLRSWIRDLLGIPHGRLTLVFESFAYKRGVPLDADFMFDVRVLPNPYYLHELRPQTGRDSGVMDYLRSQPEAAEMIGHIRQFIDRWLAGFQEDQRSYLTVAVGCTGGQHRSVYVVEQLAQAFASRVPTLVRHRELDNR